MKESLLIDRRVHREFDSHTKLQIIFDYTVNNLSQREIVEKYKSSSKTINKILKPDNVAKTLIETKKIPGVDVKDMRAVGVWLDKQKNKSEVKRAYKEIEKDLGGKTTEQVAEEQEQSRLIRALSKTAETTGLALCNSVALLLNVQQRLQEKFEQDKNIGAPPSVDDIDMLTRVNITLQKLFQQLSAFNKDTAPFAAGGAFLQQNNFNISPSEISHIFIQAFQRQSAQANIFAAQQPSGEQMIIDAEKVETANCKDEKEIDFAARAKMPVLNDSGIKAEKLPDLEPQENLQKNHDLLIGIVG